MPNTREKLVEILRKPIFPHELADPTEVVAEYLLDNDVVPVVRCKYCKHRRTHKRCYTCPKRGGPLPDDLMSYCSDGEMEDKLVDGEREDDK